MDKMVIGGKLRSMAINSPWGKKRGRGKRERVTKKLFIDSQNHKYDFKC